VAADAVALGDIELSIGILELFAIVLARLGQVETAASLLGASDKQRDLAGMPRSPPDQQHLDRSVVPARRVLAEQDWDSAYATGQTMSLDEAVSEGLAARLDAHSLARSVEES
jgi:hypothetical protein